MDEDYTEEQADQELAPLNAQLAYVAAVSAQQENALTIYKVMAATSTSLFCKTIPQHSTAHCNQI